VGVQMKNSNNLQEVNIQFMLPIPRQSLTDADLEAIKIDSKQIIGFPSNDYKLNHALSGINSASAKNSCVCCMAPSNAFKQLSEAVHRHRNPNIEPPCKDFPHREGENSIDKCHERIVKLTGGGSLPIPVERKREITAKNGSWFDPPLMDIPWIKWSHGEPLHIAGGITNHFNAAIFGFLRGIDSNSPWFENAKSILDDVSNILEDDLSLSKTGSSATQYRKDFRQCQQLLRDARTLRLEADKLCEQWQERLNNEESIPEIESRESRGRNEGEGSRCTSQRSL